MNAQLPGLKYTPATMSTALAPASAWDGHLPIGNAGSRDEVPTGFDYKVRDMETEVRYHVAKERLIRYRAIERLRQLGCTEAEILEMIGG